MDGSEERRGPVVYRSAKIGGALLAIGSLQFVASMVIVQLQYPGYSDLQNAVSDLGAATSPWAWLFNDSIRVLAVLGVVGWVLLLPAFRPKFAARAGIGILMLGLASAFAVGVFPEGSPELNHGIHGLVAVITFVSAGIGLLVLTLGMLRDTRWDGMRGYTAISGVITLAATGLSAANVFLGIGPGGMERVIIAPPLLWGIVAGVHVGRLTTFRRASARTPESDPTD